MIDIESIAKIVHGNSNAFLVVDNTFLTPYFQSPLNLGADIVMYSLTKYMNGHSDVVMGSAATNSEELHKKLRHAQNATGIVPSAFDCYLVNRGLKTLSLRMEKHSFNSLKIAEFLETHPKVGKVMHPALKSHPQHKLALKQTNGHSGIASFYLKNADIEKSTKFLLALKYFALADSLGGAESFAQVPGRMAHADLPQAERERIGITDDLIRLSVGLEDVDDLIEDLKQALDQL